MFGKKNDLLNSLDKLNIKYIFKNGKIFKNLTKSKNFSNNSFSFINGSVVELTSSVDLVESNLFLNKGLTHFSDCDFNSNIFFNISVLSCVEIYSLIQCLYILNCGSKN